MSQDFSDLEKTLAYLSSKLAPSEQKRLNRGIAMTIRRSQAQRIARQMNPDGSSYEPRKIQRKRKGERVVQGQMFKKIRTNSYLRQSSRDDEIKIFFTPRVQSIARNHHYGLVEKHGHMTIMNTQRELLGLTEDEKIAIIRAISEHLVSK